MTISHTMPPRSDHFDGARFFNPTGPPLQPFSAVPRMMLERKTRWPQQVMVGLREAIDDPVHALRDALRARHLDPARFDVLDFGESMRLP